MQTGEQRWNRPLAVAPGHWKKQLSGKVLKIAASGDLAGLKALLEAAPDSLNRRGNHGRTLLWEAVRSNKTEAVNFLLRAGADPNLTGCYNSESHVQLTAYCAAVYYRRADLAATLKGLGNDPDIFRQAFLGDEVSALQQVNADPALLAAVDPEDEIYYIPVLSFAVAGGHTGLIASLISKGAEVGLYLSLIHI